MRGKGGRMGVMRSPGRGRHEAATKSKSPIQRSSIEPTTFTCKLANHVHVVAYRKLIFVGGYEFAIAKRRRVRLGRDVQ